jgi:hypothetical protein
MSKLKDISGELMVIATMPPEKRNDKLSDLAVIIQGWKDYEISQEQKDLITTIIEGLIAENDADQIAKSKLVFVPDVEEQIAPTKKTRAKKVVAPVVESILEDLPDDIKAEELLDNLPDQVLKLAVLRNKQEGKNPIDLYETLINPFRWDRTPEGEDFWSKIHFSGDLTEFKRIYGNKGEKVDEVIEFAGLTEFVEGLSQPVSSGDLPDTIPLGSLIKNLPEPVKKLALKRQSEAGNIKNENINIVAPKSFDWVNTPEGEDFWDEIHKGNLEEFKRIFGSEGESVDNLVNGLVGFNELLEMANKQNAPAPSTSGDLPDAIQYNPSLNDLPESVMKLALFRQKEQNLPFNDDVSLADTDAFNWIATPEGKVFWETIADGDLRDFKALYGNKGEKVDAIIKPAPAVKTRKPRTPKVASVVAKQELKYLELVIYPPNEGRLELKVENTTELYSLVIEFLNKLNAKNWKLNFRGIADLGTYITEVPLSSTDDPLIMVKKLEIQFRTFVKPELDWTNFKNRATDYDRIESNNEKLFYAFKPEPVVAPKVSTPKPVKAVTPKPVKVVAPKVVKTKVTKPKVEDDLSFLNDLDNIF